MSVDGKPLALDATGKGSYALDVSHDTEGPTGDTQVIDKKIAYVVTPEGGAAAERDGERADRGGDAPARRAELARGGRQGGFTLAGQTVAGATLTIDGEPAGVQPGRIVRRYARPTSPGDTAVELRASAQGRAPRTVHLTVKKVTSLAAEAKAEESTPLLTYDQIAPDIASKVGQRAVVAGEVIEARVSGHQTIALVNDTRGCKSGPCLARIVADRGREARARRERARVRHGDARGDDAERQDRPRAAWRTSSFPANADEA